MCPRGVAVQHCQIDLCHSKQCPADPKAVCRINPCGDACSIDFYSVNNEKVDCLKGSKEPIHSIHDYSASFSIQYGRAVQSENTEY